MLQSCRAAVLRVFREPLRIDGAIKKETHTAREEAVIWAIILNWVSGVGKSSRGREGSVGGIDGDTLVCTAAQQ